MDINMISTCFVTVNVSETRDFYVRHFGAEVTFDCGWYVNLQFGKGPSTLQFMSPQEGQIPGNPAGLIHNFSVTDVDAEYERLIHEGLKPVMPIDDHPWGDRGFAVEDPNGIRLYVYSDREPADEYRQYYIKG